jgi:protein TonB
MSDFWDDEDLAPRKRRRRHNPWFARIGLGLGLAGLVAMVAWGALSLVGDSQTTKRQVVNISLMAPPPPPPPPEVKPPEPEVKEEVKVPEPEPQQAEEAAPPGEQLGLDAEGSGSGDGFGLAAKKGGKDITELGGAVNRAQFAWFTGLLQSQLQEHFHRKEKLRRSDYRVVVRVWLASDGRLDRYELVGSSGDAAIDQDLERALGEMPRLKQAPPADMPQPIKLRVTSRGAG